MSKKNGKHSIQTQIGEIETDFTEGTPVEVFSRGADKWIRGHLVKIDHHEGTALFKADDSKLKKWVHLVGYEHHKVLRLLKDKSDEDLKKIFDRFDIDKSGTLDREETIELISSVSTQLGDSLTYENCRKIVDDMDADASDEISLGELMHWYRRQYPTRIEDVIAELTYEFNKFDVEASGGLDEKECAQLLRRMELIKEGKTTEEIVATIPLSKKGDIRFEDFQQWHMKNFPGKYKFQSFLKSNDKKYIETGFGVLETDFEVGKEVEVYFRSKKKWIPGTLTVVVESDGTAQFCSKNGKQRKWINLIGSEHANVLRLPKNQYNEKGKQNDHEKKAIVAKMEEMQRSHTSAVAEMAKRHHDSMSEHKKHKAVVLSEIKELHNAQAEIMQKNLNQVQLENETLRKAHSVVLEKMAQNHRVEMEKLVQLHHRDRESAFAELLSNHKAEATRLEKEAIAWEKKHDEAVRTHQFTLREREDSHYIAMN
eukprot:g4706.t1